MGLIRTHTDMVVILQIYSNDNRPFIIIQSTIKDKATTAHLLHKAIMIIMCRYVIMFRSFIHSFN